MHEIKVFIAVAAAALGGVVQVAGSGAYIGASTIASNARAEEFHGYGDVPLRVVDAGKYRVGVFEVQRAVTRKLPGARSSKKPRRRTGIA